MERYTPGADGFGNEADMRPASVGDWIRWDDHRDIVDEWEGVRDRVVGQREEFARALDRSKARAENLEAECAKLVGLARRARSALSLTGKAETTLLEIELAAAIQKERPMTTDEDIPEWKKFCNLQDRGGPEAAKAWAERWAKNTGSDAKPLGNIGRHYLDAISRVATLEAERADVLRVCADETLQTEVDGPRDWTPADTVANTLGFLMRERDEARYQRMENADRIVELETGQADTLACLQELADNDREASESERVPAHMLIDTVLAILRAAGETGCSGRDIDRTQVPE